MYLEYDDIMRKYRNVRNRYYTTLEKRARLVSSVDLQSSKVKEVMTFSNSNTYDDSFANFSQYREELDKIINSLRNDSDMFEYELNRLESELRQSNDIYDRIYIFKWIEHRKVKEFYKLVGYSKRQTYRFIDEMQEKIREKIKMAQNGTKSMV